MKYKHIFTPTKIGNVELKNRIVFAPMACVMCAPDGEITDPQIRYYYERAKSGCAVVAVESFHVSIGGRSGPIRTAMYDDRFITGARKLAEAIHKGGAVASAYMQYAGIVSPPDLIGQIPVAPSCIPYHVKGTVPHPLSVEEIKVIEKEFAAAAGRLQKAGFDMVTIICHAYLQNQFLSPHYNKRTDEYGGSDENRTRFLLECIDETKKVVGPDFPVNIRLNAEEFYDNGYDFEFCKKLCLKLEEAGVCDINVMLGNYEDLFNLSPGPHNPPLAFVKYAEALKKILTKSTVSCVGKIFTPEQAEEILAKNQADTVFMARQYLAEENWVNKAATDIPFRPCINCNVGCIKKCVINNKPMPISCAVNYWAGNEVEMDKVLAKKTSPRKVLVIGGGPGGLEAARVAIERGHKVTLIEKRDKLGGQLDIASKGYGKDLIADYRDYLVNELEKTDAEVVLNCAYDPSLLEKYKPDAIIIATGASPRRPDISGIDRKNVFLCDDILRGAKYAGKNCVVLGGGRVGLETAEYLLDHGCKVTLITRQKGLLADSDPFSKMDMLLGVMSKGLFVYLDAQVIEIKEDSVIFEHREKERFNGPVTVPMDFVAVAGGYSPNRIELDTEIPVHVIGDANGARDIYDAIHDAGDVAYAL